MDKMLHGTVWSDATKKLVMIQFLGTRPTKYVHDNLSRWKSDDFGCSYDNLKGKLQVANGCKLGHPGLIERLRNKKNNQSWADYLDYLKHVGSLIGPDSDRMVLEMFCLHACPEIASTLLAAVDVKADCLEGDMDKAKELFYQLKGDGVLKDDKSAQADKTDKLKGGKSFGKQGKNKGDTKTAAKQHVFHVVDYASG